VTKHKVKNELVGYVAIAPGVGGGSPGEKKTKNFRQRKNQKENARFKGTEWEVGP